MPEVAAPPQRAANRDMAFVVLVSGCSSGLGRALAYELFTQKNRMTGKHAHLQKPHPSPSPPATEHSLHKPVAAAQESLCTECSLRPGS